MLVVLSAGDGHIGQPGNTGVVGEIVAVEQPKDSLSNVGLEDTLDLDVASLKVSFPLRPNSRSVGHRDGVAGNTAVGEISDETRFECAFHHDGEKFASYEFHDKPLRVFEQASSRREYRQ